MRNRNNESQEMYLETILLLQKKMGTVRGVDIAAELNYSRPSVSRAVKMLITQGYVDVSAKGEISLTASGLKIAEKVYENHRLITELFIRLGADEATADENACRIEHVISDELIELIKHHLEVQQIQEQMSL